MATKPDTAETPEAPPAPDPNKATLEELATWKNQASATLSELSATLADLKKTPPTADRGKEIEALTAQIADLKTELAAVKELAAKRRKKETKADPDPEADPPQSTPPNNPPPSNGNADPISPVGRFKRGQEKRTARWL